MRDYLDLYTEANLNEELQTVAQIIGMEAIRKLLRHFGGGYLYIPSQVDKKFSQDYIIENYDGSNREKIKRFLRISDKTFYSVLNSKRIRDKSPEGQIHPLTGNPAPSV